MIMLISRFVRFLKEYLKQKFPELKTSLYSNRRNKFVHMGIDFPLFSIENFQEFWRLNLLKRKKLTNFFVLFFQK